MLDIDEKKINSTGAQADDGDIGEACKSGTDCTPAKNFCETLSSGTKCVLPRNETCSADQCHSTAKCDGTCKCDAATKVADPANNAGCVVAGGAGQPCLTGSTCSATTDFCDQHASGGAKCVKKYGEVCTGDTDCAAGAKCSLTPPRKCACTLPKVVNDHNTGCVPTTPAPGAIGGTCGSEGECRVGLNKQAVCTGSPTGLCQCQTNFVSPPGGTCRHIQGRRSVPSCVPDHVLKPAACGMGWDGEGGEKGGGGTEERGRCGLTCCRLQEVINEQGERGLDCTREIEKA
ncbi:hypothetical protein BaRGS_00012103 [Batillaria attramentaria]|uniref:Uncharacterized protein n=1 Tax=Batillaria attramentaria TaxID=370345 RepID=A0ABD0LC60_9CAEN